MMNDVCLPWRWEAGVAVWDTIFVTTAQNTTLGNKETFLSTSQLCLGKKKIVS